MTAAAAPTSRNPRWLFGPVSDLLLGCGIAYMAVFGLLAVAAEQVEAAVPVWSFLLISLVVSAPHYGATLLRVYERREDRRAYAIFTIYLSAFIAVLFVLGVYNPLIGSLVFTLYLTWSPWHYSGQNYGLAVMFLRRRGVALDPRAKRLLYATFLLSYAVVFVVFHAGGGSEGYAPTVLQAEGYRFLPLGIPPDVANALYVGLGVLYAATLLGALFLLRRGGSLRDLGPALVLMGSQALWFAVPALARVSGSFQDVAPLTTQSAPYVGLWVAIAHALQYLWVTTYYAARDAGPAGRARYLAKALLAGSAIWGVPALLFSPSLLGTVPYNMGLFVMVSAAVNLHHFVLDGAIWKLRDQRIARVLLRSDAGPAPTGGDDRPSLLRPVIYATGLACLAIFVFGDLEKQYGVERAAARGDRARLEEAGRRLAWIGRESPKLHHQLALLAQRDGDLVRAEQEFKAALEIYETKNAWHNLGLLYERQGRHAEALEAFESALALDPRLVPTRVAASNAALALGEHERALQHLRSAARLHPGDASLRRRIAQVTQDAPADERLP